MAQDFARSFYNSARWHKCRKAYMASVFGLCERCHRPGLILHHTVELTPENIHDPAITLAFNNLQFLCLDCHNAIHANELPTRENLTFTPDGDIVEAPCCGDAVSPSSTEGCRLAKYTGSREGGGVGD